MSKQFQKFFYKYISNLNNILKNIEPKQLEKLSKFFEYLIKSKKRIFIAGNGGSASTASTMTNDLGFDLFKKKGIFVNFHSLVDNVSVITAISNDTGYENLFLNQLKMQHKIGDHLLVISASGNSKNLINAIKFVKKRKGKIISFLGFDGGKVKKYSDILIHLKTDRGEYGPVEDAHLIINHVLSHWFQNISK